MTDVLDVLAQRSDLTPFGNNAILFFALELATGIEDVQSVAASALTDTSNDKSGTAAWMTVVPSLAEFSGVLTDALVPNFRSVQRRDASLRQFTGILGAILKMQPDVYAGFAREVEFVS